MSYKFAYLIFCSTLLFSCSKDYIPLNLGNTTLKIEIAKTDQERAKGLMFRDSLPEDFGMLFVFESEKRVSFWMKDTKIPLSIAYIGKDGTIYEIYDLIPYSQDPVISKRSSVMYALEVNKGFFNRNDIRVGDKINLDQISTYLKSSK